MKNIITFEASAKKEILSFFDKSIDEDGFIVEKNDSSQRIITTNGEEVRLDEFAGLKAGSEIFIKSDLISLINLSDRLE